MSEAMPVVEAVKLTKHFALKRGLFSGADRGAVRAVDGISFTIPPGKTLGVVGESGCGKTTTAKLVLLLEEPTGGSIRFLGKELGGLGGVNLRDYRKSVQAVFQDPFASLNPRMRVGTIIAEPLITNETLEAPEVKRRIRHLLELVGLPDRAADLFPHEFSGGQRQRIAIARSLAVSPKLIVLDEPVSALDVSIRAQILNLLRDLQAQLGVSYLFIAHDLAAVAHMSHEIAVMYLGQIVEMGLAETVARDPKHPYTQALFSAALPSHPEDIRDDIILQGEVPSPVNPPGGLSLPSPLPLRHAPVHGRATAAHAGRGAPDRLPPVRSEGVSRHICPRSARHRLPWAARCRASPRRAARAAPRPASIRPSERGTPRLALVLLSRGDSMAPTEEGHMEQLRSAISVFLKREPARRRDWRRSHGASKAGSTWLDRLTDLLLIFRRPVPVPVRTRRF